MPTDDIPLTLTCHPATPAPLVRTLEARVATTHDGALRIAYCLWGDIARWRIPDEQPAQAADLLWEHTCFEAFIGLPGSAAYREFNFSPAGLWAIYDFSAYRQRRETADAIPGEVAAPVITTRRHAGRLEVDAIIPASALPAGPAALDIGLCAVVEAADVVDGRHSYWALAHCAQRPDFHLRQSFTLLQPHA